jgi:hypothetical protein
MLPFRHLQNNVPFPRINVGINALLVNKKQNDIENAIKFVPIVKFPIFFSELMAGLRKG